MASQATRDVAAREWTELTSLFLYFAAAAIVWAGLALYSWRVAEAALPQSQDFVQHHGATHAPVVV